LKSTRCACDCYIKAAIRVLDIAIKNYSPLPSGIDAGVQLAALLALLSLAEDQVQGHPRLSIDDNQTAIPSSVNVAALG